MKRKFIYAGLIASAMLITTSCVDSNESQAVKDLRAAKVEELKASTTLKTADVKFKEAQTALSTEMLAFEKANNQLKLALAKTNNEKAIAEAKTELEVRKLALENQKLNTEHELAKYKQTLKEKSRRISS